MIQKLAISSSRDETEKNLRSIAQYIYIERFYIRKTPTWQNFKKLNALREIPGVIGRSIRVDVDNRWHDFCTVIFKKWKIRIS